MERIKREATIDSLTHLESYYQSRYEHYLAMATEAKEHRERVGLLLQDLCRNAHYLELESINGSQHNGSASDRSSDPDPVSRATRVPETVVSSVGCKIQRRDLLNGRNAPSSLLPSTESDLEKDSSAAAETEQMKKFHRNLSIAMSVIESVSNSDSGKTLHQNYLHHLLNTELEQELSVELVELYLSEAISRGLIERDEFDNKCYIAKLSDDDMSHTDIAQNPDVATENRLLLSPSRKPYDLPPSDKLKPTLFETIEGYIALNRPKRFSIDDVINYLYPQPIQLDWDKALKNKVRSSISNVLGRKAYLGKHWSRIKPGVYRPLT